MEYMTFKQWEMLSEKEKNTFAGHKILVPEGQLLTMTDREAKEYGFSQGSYASLDDFLKAKGWRKIGEMQTTWSENMVRVIGSFAPILMLIGFGALYMEFKTPGLSIFGAIGIVCLGIVFGSKYAVGLANYTELILLLAGFALFLAEIYLFPGTFIAGTLGIFLMIAALTLSLQDFTLPDPEMPWEFKSLIDNLSLTLGMAVLAVFIPLLAIRYLLPYLPAGARVISDATLADARAVVPETRRMQVGFAGLTKTPLRPTGKAVFGDQTLEVTSQGEFIGAGVPVEVSRIQGNTITVRPREPSA
jgi:membrane-bound serine protease (ClpP class)